MKTDAEIKEDVTREPRWDLQISEPEAIGVAVNHGAVTLTGHTPTNAEKLAAARAAERVYGVRAVANDINVELVGTPRDDSEIATAIAHVMDNNVQIPPNQVRARVQNGWVTLAGNVRYDFQRREVARMVRNVRGVVGVTDLITVTPPASPERVREAIEDTFRREAEVDARHISVEVSDHSEALRARALPEGGERRKGSRSSRARDCHRGEPPPGLAVASIPGRGQNAPARDQMISSSWLVSWSMSESTRVGGSS